MGGGCHLSAVAITIILTFCSIQQLVSLRIFTVNKINIKICKYKNTNTTFLKLFATNKLRMKTEALSIVDAVNLLEN